MMPLYVREGSILPFGPEISYTAEKPAGDLTLYVYTGRDAGFTLYEDEGINYDYEKGEFSTIPLTWDEESGRLTIGASQGAWDGMPETRTLHIVWVTPEKPVVFDLSATPPVTVAYKGAEVVVEKP